MLLLLPQPIRATQATQQWQVFRPLLASTSELELRQLPLDGLEALRLADLEGLYHEEAAQRMGVSSSTFARVLTTARGTVADALVNGKVVQIDGGKVEPRGDDRWPCPIHEVERRRGRGCRCTGRGR